MSVKSTKRPRTPPGHITVDALVIGGGFSGLYALHKLRQLGNGFKVVVLEAGNGIGGTWYWNKYPGCRCDVPSVEYSFSNNAFEGLEQSWRWTEMMAAQPEIERYANHIADTYDLRRGITTNTKVTGASFDDRTTTWTVSTNRGVKYSCRFLVTAVGCLSTPNLPDIYYEAASTFNNGPVIHTGKWPRQQSLQHLLSGKRVGVIGTGSSGIQVIPEIAKVAKHLTVFQRTPQYTLPANNHPLDDRYISVIKSRYDELRRVQRQSGAGISLVQYLGGQVAPPDTPLPLPLKDERIIDLTEEERRLELERSGFEMMRKFTDTGYDPKANEILCGLYRMQVKRVVHDPKVAEALTPRGYPIGCKRQVIDTNYFETFNRPNVRVVDMRQGNGIGAILPSGIRTIGKNAEDHELDVIVFATGFDALSGPLMRLNLTGLDNVPLSSLWKDEGPKTYLGVQVHKFPNLFTITGPGSPSVLSNMICSIEQHVDFIFDTIKYMDKRCLARIECTEVAQSKWSAEVNQRAAHTMLTAASCASWYLGSNIPGKPRTFMIYLGVGDYRKRCDDIVKNDYEGFVFRSSYSKL